jgi:hypothetical protein
MFRVQDDGTREQEEVDLIELRCLSTSISWFYGVPEAVCKTMGYSIVWASILCMAYV